MKIGVIDIETTHFFDKGGSILEVGIVIIDTDKNTLNKAFSSLCKEKSFSEKDKDAWIFQNSDLTYDEIDKCDISFDDIKDEVQSKIAECDIMTAYNKAFDFEFLQDRGIRIDNAGKCIMLEATKICKIPKNPYWAKKNPDDPWKWANCEEAWEFMFPSIAYIEKHRALDDCIHEALICHRMINQCGINMREDVEK